MLILQIILKNSLKKLCRFNFNGRLDLSNNIKQYIGYLNLDMVTGNELLDTIDEIMV